MKQAGAQEQFLINRGFSLEDVQDLTPLLEAKHTYKTNVSPRLTAAQKLHTLSDLLSILTLHTMQDFGKANDIIGQTRERMLFLAEQSGGDRSKAETIFFGNQESGEEGMITSLQKRWTKKGIASSYAAEIEIGHTIVEACEAIFGHNPDLAKIFSREKSISIRTAEGERLVSSRELFANNLDRFTRQMSKYEQLAAEAQLVDPLVATYDAFEWTKQVAQRSASEGMSIFPTPDTERVKEEIRIASSKRNGLLKYILYGEAGVGKTKIIQSVNTEAGKDTVVINFHEFITFEELIGQTAMTVNLEGGTNDKFEGILRHFGQMENVDFWKAMSNVYMHLPQQIKKQFLSVEDMVVSYGKGVDSIENIEDIQINSMPETGRSNSIREQFLNRMQAIQDMTLLGISDPTKDNFQARWIQGAIINAMKSGQVVCFDEMDKAGPYAIEGLLSFLSVEPGQVWNFQGGSIKIPDDFSITATSNRSNIGALANSQEMNRYLADRTEQIQVEPQSVKGSLMIAAASLSDTKGNLLINQEEQVQLITAFSYILPELQAANLSMPVTNRIIRTICSRLVNFQETASGARKYSRILTPSGQPQTVAEALRLSVLDLKGMSLGESGKKKVTGILSSYSELMGEQSIRRFGSSFRIEEDHTEAHGSMERRKKVIENIWEQPLFQAIGALQVDAKKLGKATPFELDLRLLDIPNLEALLSKRGTIDQKVTGRKNGIILNVKTSGIYMETHLPGSLTPLHSQKVNGATSSYTTTITTADQLGNTFATSRLIRTDRQPDVPAQTVEIYSAKKTIETLTNIKSVMIDPLGEYVIYSGNGHLTFKSLKKGSEYIDSKSIANSSEAEVVDVSPDGTSLLIANDGVLCLLTLDRKNLLQEDFPLLPLGPSEGAKAGFLGNNLLVLLNGQTRRAIAL